MNKKNKQDIISKLNKVTFDRSKLTIQNWKTAQYAAESATNPIRTYLYKIYRELNDDDSLTDCLDLLKDKIKQHQFNILNLSGSVNKPAQKIFENKWFNDFIDIFVDTDFWGHSLMQIDGDIIDSKFSVALVPRENVSPDYGVWKRSWYDSANIVDGTNVIKYDTESPFLFEMKGKTNIGLFNKLAPIILYKKMSIMYWAEFQERNGMPLMVVKTPTNDMDHKQKISEWHETMGANGLAIIDTTDEITFENKSVTDAFNVYLQMMKWCESQIQKFILGATELTDGNSGGSEARAKVHSEQFEVKLRSILKRIEFYVNEVVIPKLSELGLISNVKFEFQNRINYSEKSEKADYYSKISKIVVENGKQLDSDFMEKELDIKLSKNDNSNIPTV